MAKLSFKNGTRQAYFKLAEEWADCERCPLHEYRTNVVHCRGQLPADLVLVGEAPGLSEDALGFPFVGPAGQYLNRIIEDLVPESIRLAIMNIVGCVPWDGRVIRPPKKVEVKHCQPRLSALLDIARPRLIVTMGATAKRFIPEADIPVLHVIHPSAIIRRSQADPRGADLDEKRMRLTIKAAVERLKPRRPSPEADLPSQGRGTL